MARAKRSKRIEMYDPDKLKKVNSESKRLIREYEKDMVLRELSPTTRKGYLNDLNQWLIYVLDNQDNISVLEIDEDLLTDFFYFCKSEGNNTQRMRRRYASISAFYKFLRKKRKIVENPMEFIDRPIKNTEVVQQTYLTAKQIDDMKQKLTECGNLTLEVYGLLSLSTMARVNAIAHIRWEQIDFSDRVIRDVLEKEGKIVTLFFSEEVKQKLINLQHFRVTNDVDDGGWLFFSKQDDAPRAVSTNTLYQWCKKIGKMISVESLHPHDFRHSAAQQLKLAGMPLEDISVLLNHESTETTRKHYLQIDTKSLRESKDKFGI